MATLSYKWNHEKNRRLKSERGIGFEQVVLHIEQGDLLDVMIHPNSQKYPNQELMIVEISQYAYVVPFVREDQAIFLKTIIPSRKATRKYLRGRNGKNKT